MSFGKLLIVYHIYQNNIYYLHPFSSRCARLRIYMYWQSGELELAGKVKEAEITLRADVLNRVNYPAHFNLIARDSMEICHFQLQGKRKENARYIITSSVARDYILSVIFLNKSCITVFLYLYVFTITVY